LAETWPGNADYDVPSAIAAGETPWQTALVTTQPTDATQSLPALVDTYCRRIGPAVLQQHAESSISSPLGIWLLLAACATAASGGVREQLEEVLGCSTSEAAAFLDRILTDPPPALQTAAALWVRGADRTTALVEWSATLPKPVERGPIPSRAEADAWAERTTSGLIKHFPLEISALTRVILASALATKVTWVLPFRTEPSGEHLRRSSPWSGRIQNVLVDYHPLIPSMLARTEAAGVVAVHFAVATDGLGVISVAADPVLDRHVAFEAAYEIARRCRDDALGDARCSLFDIPLGEGHSWETSELEVLTERAGERTEEIESAALVSWSVEGELDLQRSDLFGVEPAFNALLALIGPSPAGDQCDAVQSAIASYTQTGFEAAAISSVAITAAGMLRTPREKGLHRTARLLFDHPYAAIALAGSQSDFTRARAGHTEMFGLPLFTAWVAQPAETELAHG
jgi:hypothetical protein